MPVNVLLCVILSYLLGSCASAVIVSHAMGNADPRSHGSGNPGTTNVLRLSGKFAALLTLIGDMSKSLIPIMIMKLYDFDMFSINLVAGSAFLGHLYPIFFKFRGGKGVATFLGAMFGLYWKLGCILAIIWLFTAWRSKYSSLAAIIMSICAPYLAWYFAYSWHSVLIIALMSLLLIMRHHSNIKNLFLQKEPKLKFIRG